MDSIEEASIPDYLSHLPKDIARKIVDKMAVERSIYDKIKNTIFDEENLPEITAKQIKYAEAFKLTSS